MQQYTTKWAKEWLKDNKDFNYLVQDRDGMVWAFNEEPIRYNVY